MSKICYMIQIWGSTRPSWINQIQRIQNKAARYVLRKNRYTKISELMTGCKWLSVNQLNNYHLILLLRKVWFSNGFCTLKQGLSMDNEWRFRPINGRINNHQGLLEKEVNCTVEQFTYGTKDGV